MRLQIRNIRRYVLILWSPVPITKMHRAVTLNWKIGFLTGQYLVILIINILFMTISSLSFSVEWSGIKTSNFPAVSMDCIGHQGNWTCLSVADIHCVLLGEAPSNSPCFYSKVFPTDSIHICSKIVWRYFWRFHVSNLHSKPNVSPTNVMAMLMVMVCETWEFFPITSQASLPVWKSIVISLSAATILLLWSQVSFWGKLFRESELPTFSL